MGDIAAISLSNEDLLYKMFGINAELLIDHAWGYEPTTMRDIKGYKTEGHSLNTGQVLSRPYKYEEGKLVFKEMADLLCADLLSKNLTTSCLTWWISFDPESLNVPSAPTWNRFSHKMKQIRNRKGTVKMFDKTAHRPNSLPGREHKRFEKTRSRRIYPAICGLRDSPQQASRWQLLAIGALLAYFIGTHILQFCHPVV